MRLWLFVVPMVSEKDKLNSNKKNLAPQHTQLRGRGLFTNKLNEFFFLTAAARFGLFYTESVQDFFQRTKPRHRRLEKI